MATPIHYVNLTNGLNCRHLRMINDDDLRFVRIQSTRCEQKQWALILRELGADFYVYVLHGFPVVVHDVSERPRETRAMWQGLSWIRYVLNRVWHDKEVEELSRGGIDVTPYWRHEFAQLTKSDLAAVKYYRKFDPSPIDLSSCWDAANSLGSDRGTRQQPMTP